MKTLVVLGVLLTIHASIAEEILKHSKLPSYSSTSPESFQLSMSVASEDPSTAETFEFDFTRSSAIASKVPVFEMFSTGKQRQIALSNLAHTSFYQDVQSGACLSLSSFDGEDYSMRGSFMGRDGIYDIEPFHSNMHKRSLRAKQGDHVVRKRGLEENAQQGINYMHNKEFEQHQQEEYMKFFDPNMTTDGTEPTEPQEPAGPMGPGAHANDTETGPSHYTVEIYVILDFYAYDKLKEAKDTISWVGSYDEFVVYIIGHQLNEVDLRFRNIDTAPWTISTVFIGITIAKTEEDSLFIHGSNSSDSYLDGFTSLIAFRDWLNDTDLAASDHYMFITGLDLAFNVNNQTVGVTFQHQMCRESVSICEFKSYSGHYAHEIAHSLGAGHDNSSECSKESQNIMSPVLSLTNMTTRGNNWHFSQCSINQMDAYVSYLTSMDENCLLDNATTAVSWRNNSERVFGEDITPDEQCVLNYGTSYVFYEPRSDEVCHALWCYDKENPSFAHAISGASTYTSCGDDKWCVEERCVDKSSSMMTTTDETMTDIPTTEFACLANDPVWTLRCDLKGYMKCEDVTKTHCDRCSRLKDTCCNSCKNVQTCMDREGVCLSIWGLCSFPGVSKNRMCSLLCTKKSHACCQTCCQLGLQSC